MFSLPDNRFDSVPLLEVVKIIEGVIDKINPRVVYTQHGGDLNIDHSIVYRATLTATRPFTGSPVKDLYAFEVASSSEWAFHQFAPAFHPPGNRRSVPVEAIVPEPPPPLPVSRPVRPGGADAAPRSGR